MVGPNAAGKTNMLEAVYVLARGNSFKNKDKELIKSGKDWSRLDGLFDSGSRTIKLEPQKDNANKTIQIESKKFSRLPIKQFLPIVLFEPNHLNLFIRGPKTRREYFDDYLSASAPGYKPTLSKYKRTLAQRNRLIKSKNYSEPQLFAWNVKFSELAGELVQERLALVDKLNKKLSKIYSSVANKKSTIKISYQTSLRLEDYGSSLLLGLGRQAELDRLRGFTGLGPHREDYEFSLNGLPASASASRGETRTLLLALKIFELVELQELSGQKPLLLLDDVFSELDGARRRYLVDYLKNYQTIITTTDADAVTGYFLKNSHKIIALS